MVQSAARNRPRLDAAGVLYASAAVLTAAFAALVAARLLAHAQVSDLALGACIATAGTTAAVAFGARSLAADSSDAELTGGRSRWSDVGRVMGRLKVLWAVLAVYFVCIVGLGFVRGGAKPLAVVLVLLAQGAWIVYAVWQWRRVVTIPGLESAVLVKAAASAFASTALAALLYGIAQTAAPLPDVSPWLVYGWAMLSWLVASIALNRRYR
jgi:hypothetical protein